MASNEGARLRKEISDLIKQVHCQQNQNLRDVTLPEEVYRRSRKFTRTNTKHCLYYPTLNKMEGGVYALLMEAAGEASVEEANGLLHKWIEAINSLLRYALNLLLAPNRPELKTVKLYTSYFVYQISDKLKGTEKILFVLGYHPKQRTSCESSLASPSQELVYKEKVDRDHVAEVATDLVILGSDLEYLQEKIREQGSHSRSRWFTDVLRAWNDDLKNIMIRSAYLGDSRDGAFDDLEVNRFHSAGLDGRYKTGHENLHMGGVHATGGGSNLVVGIGGIGMDRNSHMDNWNDSAEIMVRPQQDRLYQFNTRPVNDTVGSNVNNGRIGYGLQSSYDSQDCPVHVPPTVQNQKEEFGYRYKSKCDERLSIDTSADEDSFPVIAQNIPRPNVDDLPDPVSFESKGDEHVGIEDPYNSGLNWIVNARSDDPQDSLIGQQYRADMPPDQSLVSPGMWIRREENYGGREENYGEVMHEDVQAPVSEVGPSICDSPVQQRQPSSPHAFLELDDYDIIEMDQIPLESSQCLNEVQNKPSGINAKTDKIQPGSSKEKLNYFSTTKLTEGSSLLEAEGENGFTVVDMDTNKNGNTKGNEYKCNTEKSSPPEETVKSVSEKGTRIPSMWTCDFCTYINSSDTFVCGICGIDKNKTK